jgi:hypothetical protein
MVIDNRDVASDPGWRTALRGSLWMLVPALAIRRQNQRIERGGDGLVALRLLFVTFALSLVLIGVVVAVLAATGGEEGDIDAGWVIAGVIAYGVVSLVMIRFFRPGLDCTNKETLSRSYRTRFFLRIASSDAAALMGFVGFILTWNPLLYPIGLAFAAVGFSILAPTAANLARDQMTLTLGGCGRNLVADLRGGTSG